MRAKLIAAAVATEEASYPFRVLSLLLLLVFLFLLLLFQSSLG